MRTVPLVDLVVIGAIAGFVAELEHFARYQGRHMVCQRAEKLLRVKAVAGVGLPV